MQNVMSALPPKADICSAQTYVRFVPKAVIEGVNRKTASRRSPQNSFCIGHAGFMALALNATHNARIAFESEATRRARFLWEKLHQPNLSLDGRCARKKFFS